MVAAPRMDLVNIDAGTVSIVDPATNSVRTTLDVDKGPLSIAPAAGDVWISNSEVGQVWRAPAAQ